MPPIDATLDKIASHLAAGEFDKAAALLRATLARSQNNPQAHYLAANLAIQRGELDRALHHARQAIRLRPDIAEYHVTLGEVHSRREEFEQAAESLRLATRADPSHYTAHLGLGKMLERLDRYDEAIGAYEGCVRIAPGDFRSLAHLTGAQIVLGRSREVVDLIRGVQAQRPPDQPDPVLQQGLCFATNYLHDEPPERIAQEHRAFGAVLGRTFPPHWRDEPGPREPPIDRPLRIGYLSPDFRQHAVAFFIEPVLKHHDRTRFEITCYSTHSGEPDHITERLRSLVERWRDVGSVYDLALAQMIRDDKIDILIDLAGMTTRGRLPALALKAAPIQITWIGYPHSTGLTSVDYRIVGALTDPPGAEAHCVEKLLRLDPCFLCYKPPDDAPDPAPAPPCVSAGHITFGSFNALAKISEPACDAWAAILRAVPDSRLLLKARGLRDPVACERLRAMFASRSINAERLELIGYTDAVTDHLTYYNQVDIALDTFPYNGTTTTCEAMWMGVPVVALEGNTHAGRVGLSLLHAVGVPDLVARTPDAYIERATALARDTARLTALHATLRERMASSPLCDGPSFTRRLEATLTRVYCAGPQPA